MSETTPSMPVTLPLTQWQTVLNILADQPFRVAAPLINELQRQLSAPPASPPGE